LTYYETTNKNYSRKKLKKLSLVHLSHHQELHTKIFHTDISEHMSNEYNN